MLVAHATLATDSCRDVPAQWATVPVYSVLLEHPEGRVLFDTGCHPDLRERWSEDLLATTVWEGSRECHLPARLEQLGLRPGDIDVVVASHLHCDHAGCLEYLSGSRIIVHRDELRAALEQLATGCDAGYVDKDVRAWIDTGLDWEIVDDIDQEIPIYDGVRVLNLGPGHSEGLLALHVSLPDTGALILASDACYGQENWGPPTVLPGVGAIFDNLGMVRTISRLRRVASETDATIWFGHDAEQFAALRKGLDDFYE
jgi:N-acyl homoserine lactone hydrolase